MHWQILLTLSLCLVFCGCDSARVEVGPKIAPSAPTVPPAPIKRAGNPSFDNELANHLPAGFPIYAAIGNLGDFARFVSPPVEAVPGEIFGQSIAAISTTTGLASQLRIINKALVEKGYVKASVLEALAGPTVLAAGPSDDGEGLGRYVVVTAKDVGSSRLFDTWLAEIAVVEPFSLSGMAATTDLMGRRFVFEQGGMLIAAPVGSAIVFASDEDCLRGALEARAGSRSRLCESPMVKALEWRVEQQARAFLLLDLPALVGLTPAFPSEAGRKVQLMQGPKKPSLLFRGVKGLAVELVEEKGALVCHAKALLDPESERARSLKEQLARSALVGPRLVGESASIYFGMTYEFAKLTSFSALNDLSAVPGTVGGLAQGVSSRAESLAHTCGVSWERDFIPWVGYELSLFGHWELRYPQIGCILATRDAKKTAQVLVGVRERLAAQGRIFAEKTVGDRSVFYTRYQGADPREFEPVVAVTDDFFVASSGRRPLESLFQEREKLEGTPGIGLLMHLFAGRLQWCLRVDTRLLLRLIEAERGRAAVLTPVNHGLCTKNLLAIERGETHPQVVHCPSGGAYLLNEGVARCSLHGSFSEPERPRQALERRTEVIDSFRRRYRSLCVGAGLVSDDLFQCTVVLPRFEEEGEGE